MKNRKVFVKIVFFLLIVLFLLSLIVPVIFSQTAPKKENLLNGLKVLMWSDAKADKVSVKLRIHSGSAFDPQGKEGLMRMLSENLFPNDAAKEFFTEDLGGSLEVINTYDHIQINASSKPDQFLTMLETLAGAVSNPAIDKETTARLRTALTDRVKAMASDPASIADQAVAGRLLGTFPYGRPVMGTEASLGKLEYADLVDARQRFLTADNATIAVSGNFDRTLALRAIKRYFGSWLKADRRVPATFRQPDAPLPAVLTVASPKADVTAIRFAARGAARGEKDFAAARLFAAILESRLKARVPAAHSSSVFARSDSYLLPGLMTIGFAAGRNDVGTGNGKIDVTDLMIKTLADAVTEAEFQAAKDAAAAGWQTRDNELFWLDNDTYKTTSPEADRGIFETVTLADVRAFAERFKASPMASVLVNSPG